MKQGDFEVLLGASMIGLLCLVAMIIPAHAVLCGSVQCPQHSGTGIDQSEYANNNKNGQACGGASMLECEILAEIHNDFASLFGYMQQLIDAENQNTNELRVICKHLSTIQEQSQC